MSRYGDFLNSSRLQTRSARWGGPEADPYVVDGVFALPFTRFGDVLVRHPASARLQYRSEGKLPFAGSCAAARYLAFYAFLRHEFRRACGDPHGQARQSRMAARQGAGARKAAIRRRSSGRCHRLYPFIVNSSRGNAGQAPHGAIIIDHLTPPLTRAESYGPLKDLEALVDECYEASGGDPAYPAAQQADPRSGRRYRARSGCGDIEGRKRDRGAEKTTPISVISKEMQIRDRLHVFGVSPEGGC